MNNEERTIARIKPLNRQHRRSLERKATKRRPQMTLPTHFTTYSFLARLEKRPLSYLGRQQARLKRLLANCTRLVSEHGGPDSAVARIVGQDEVIWQRQLALVQGLIVKRTMLPAKRDSRPRRIQRMAKAS